jgi:hypothetical protein
MRGGFLPGGRSTSLSFCRGASGPWLSVSVAPVATAVAAGPNDTRIHLDLVSPGPCANPGWTGAGLSGMAELPALQGPNGIPLQSTGGGGSGAGWWSEAVALTAIGAPELATHFGEQFLAAGWEQVDQGADGPLAWSTWQRSTPAAGGAVGGSLC